MADITCAKCAEPWDAYGVRNGDMEPHEARRFLKGEGCPCCGFGHRCSACDGSGREQSFQATCGTCFDKGYVLAWQPRNDANASTRFRSDRLYTGYEPQVRRLPDSALETRVTLGVRSLPEKAETIQTLDGPVDQWWVVCPEGCATVEEPRLCTVCEGSGKLSRSSEELELLAAESEINASDEDAFDILERRGLA